MNHLSSPLINQSVNQRPHSKSNTIRKEEIMKKVVFVSVLIVALFISSAQALSVPTSKLVSNFSSAKQVAKLKFEKEVYFKLPLKSDFLLNEELSPITTPSKLVFHPIQINGCTYLLDETVVVYCYVDSGPMPSPLTTPSV